jgi:hypothetical protein
VASIVILSATPAYKSIDFDATDNLDSLIVNTLKNEPLIGSNFRIYRIEVDSNFTRIVYRVPVHPSFSKTMFHYRLHKMLSKFEIESPARVVFPERDMNIYIYDNGTIKSTIRLITTEPKAEDE